MQVFRTLLCLVAAAPALVLPVATRAQAVAAPDTAFISFRNTWQAPGRPTLGLHIGRVQSGLPCASIALFCDSAASNATSRLYANTLVGERWGVELGYMDLGRLAGPHGQSRGQGLNLSLVGQAPLGRSIGVFGKVGTTYGRTETSVLGAGAAAGPDQAFGLSYGAGVSFAFTPRLSATLEWDSNDFRFAGGTRDPVRSTSLGLQFRY